MNKQDLPTSEVINFGLDKMKALRDKLNTIKPLQFDPKTNTWVQKEEPKEKNESIK